MLHISIIFIHFDQLYFKVSPQSIFSIVNVKKTGTVSLQLQFYSSLCWDRVMHERSMVDIQNRCTHKSWGKTSFSEENKNCRCVLLKNNLLILICWKMGLRGQNYIRHYQIFSCQHRHLPHHAHALLIYFCLRCPCLFNNWSVACGLTMVQFSQIVLLKYIFQHCIVVKSVTVFIAGLVQYI